MKHVELSHVAYALLDFTLYYKQAFQTFVQLHRLILSVKYVSSARKRNATK